MNLSRNRLIPMACLGGLTGLLWLLTAKPKPSFPLGYPDPDAPPAVWAEARKQMVAEQCAARGIADARVLAAMNTVPREEFVMRDWRPLAYTDQALLLPDDQRIPQPYIIARMIEELHLQPEDRVLTISTGSGYETAILSRIVREVYSVETFPALAYETETNLERLGGSNIHVRTGDGQQGWPEAGPFDAILLPRAVTQIPPELIHQLKEGGRLVAPVGLGDHQELQCFMRKGSTGTTENLLPVIFIPLRSMPR